MNVDRLVALAASWDDNAAEERRAMNRPTVSVDEAVSGPYIASTWGEAASELRSALATSDAPTPRPSPTFPAVDPARDLPAAAALIRRVAAERHPNDGVLLGMAADVLEAAESEATYAIEGRDETCLSCQATVGTSLAYVLDEHTVSIEDGPGSENPPTPCCGSDVAVHHVLATTPPAEGVATLYDAVLSALNALADDLPGEPPVILAWDPATLAGRVTDLVETSGFLTAPGGPR